MIGLWMVAAASAAPEGCDTSVDSQALVAALGAAEAAFSNMDLQGFADAKLRADGALACLSEPLLTVDAASVHRVAALNAFLSQDQDAAVAAFAALRIVEPGYKLPTSIAPEGNPLRQAWDEAGMPKYGPPIEMPTPKGRHLLVDGLRRLERPTTRPAVVQLVDPEDGVLWTQWTPPGGELPEYEVGKPDTIDVVKIDEPPRFKTSGKIMMGTGVAAVAAGIGCYGAAWGTRKRFDNPETPYEDLHGLRRSTNGLTVASGALAAAGVALGVTAAVTW